MWAWISGYNDCKNGVEHRQIGEFQSDYDRGYAARYEQEQVEEYLTR